jgi:hypothetical protein
MLCLGGVFLLLGSSGRVKEIVLVDLEVIKPAFQILALQGF